jgi:VWFA-related protein
MIPAAAQAAPLPQPSSPPERILDLASLGFTGLSRVARLSGAVNVSVDFLDRDHLLVTFNPKKLFKRLAECPITHADRVVHAVVLETTTGKVLKQTDWYLHDDARYVWALGSGRFLLRRLNRLYEVDSDLTEKLVLDSPTDLVWVSVTAGGQQIVAETLEKNSADNDSKDKALVKLSFLEANSLELQRAINSHGAIRLEATTSGFADALRRPEAWLVRFGFGAKDRINVTRVKAMKSPNILYSSRTSMLVGRCSLNAAHYNASSFSIAGKFLWRRQWDGCRYGPAVRRSEDGRRFALSTLVPRNKAAANMSSEDFEDTTDSLDQTVEVIETASGSSVLSLPLAPGVMDAENVSLSPDGRQLAVLADSTIAIYPLPDSSTEEHARYAALKADPELQLPPPGTDKSKEEPLEISATKDPPLTGADTSAPSSDAKPETKSAPKSTDPSAAPPADAPPADDQPSITLRTGTQVVALDVVVSDSKGQIIRDLPQDEFVISEDGKPQILRYFHEYNDTKTTDNDPAPAAAPPPDLPPNIFSNAGQPTVSTSSVVILFDLLNTPPLDQARAQVELMKFLKAKPSGLQFALFSLSSRLQMLEGFTQDGGLLLATAAKKGSQRYRPTSGSDTLTQVAIDSAKSQASITASFAGRGFIAASGNADSLVDSLKAQQAEALSVATDHRMFVTVNAFAQLARWLSGVPGRKNLVWLSGSFPLTIFPDTSGRSPFSQERDYTENVRKAANLLAEAHVAVYPVSVLGLVGDPVYNPTDSQFGVSNRNSSPAQSTGPPPTASPLERTRPSANFDETRTQATQTENSEHESMKLVASETGGEAFYNKNGIAQAITAASEHGANYYALSYTPTNKRYDGSFRKVKVTLKGTRYHLAYRNGYYAVDPNTTVQPARDLGASLALVAMQPGAPESRQIVFATRVVPVGKPHMVTDDPANSSRKRKASGPRNLQHYAIDYLVSPSDLRFAPGSDGKYHDTLHFMMAAADDQGRLLANRVSQVAADFTPRDFKTLLGTGLRMHQEVEVPVASTAIRLGVEDTANSHIGTVEVPLPVPVPPDVPDAEHTTHSLPPIEPD